MPGLACAQVKRYPVNKKSKKSTKLARSGNRLNRGPVSYIQKFRVLGMLCGKLKICDKRYFGKVKWYFWHSKQDFGRFLQ